MHRKRTVMTKTVMQTTRIVENVLSAQVFFSMVFMRIFLFSRLNQKDPTLAFCRDNASNISRSFSLLPSLCLLVSVSLFAQHQVISSASIIDR